MAKSHKPALHILDQDGEILCKKKSGWAFGVALEHVHQESPESNWCPECRNKAVTLFFNGLKALQSLKVEETTTHG